MRTLRKNLKMFFGVAMTLAFLVFSHQQIIFAAAPTVTTGVASSVTKTTATIEWDIDDDGGAGISTNGIEYGTTISYGSSSSVNPYQADSFFSFALGFGTAESQADIPLSFVIDSLGNFIIADTNNHRIQKYDSSGNFISMFGWGVDTGADNLEVCVSGCEAGTPGTEDGRLNFPSDIAVDAANNIYVVDTNNNRVQKFNSAGAFQSKFGSAGTAENQFSMKTGISVDTSGNIYVADFSNNRVQKFNSSGVFQLMFGWGVDTGANNFEVCTSGCQSGAPGSGDGQFNFTAALFAPLTGIAFDSAGNVFVADPGNNRVQKFNSSGVYQDKFGLAGNNTGEINLLRDIFIDANDDIYILDENGVSFNERIQKFSSGFDYISSREVGDANHSSIYLDSDLSVYVLGPVTGSILKFFQLEGSVNLSGLTCGTTYHYRAFATNNDGTSYGNDATFTTSACDTPVVETRDAWGISKVLATLHGLQTSDGVSASTARGFEYGLTSSYGTTVSSSGSLGLSSFGTQGSGDAEFELPSGVYVDSADRIYVADTGNHRVQVLDEFGSLIRMFGWGVETGAAQFEICTSGCQAGTSGNGSGRFSSPEAVVVDESNGEIYVADTGNNRIQVFNSSGGIERQFGTLGSSPGQLSGPKGLAVMNDGTTKVFVADTGNHRLQKFDSIGTSIDVVGEFGSDFGQLSSPEQISVGPDGYLHVADTGNNRYRKYDTNLNPVLQNGVGIGDLGDWLSPAGVIAIDKNIYLVDSGNDRVVHLAVDNSGEFLTVSGFGQTGSSNGQFSAPGQVALDGDDVIFVADTGNHRIQKFKPFFSTEISGLTCNKEYFFRTFSTNDDGTAYGAMNSFMTSECGSSTTGGGSGPGPNDRYGCIDPSAINWDPSAIINDGSCQYSGCTDPLAINHITYANVDDGSCQYASTPVPGCTDPLATNYNPLANTNNGSCLFDDSGPGPTPKKKGCTDTFAINFDSSAEEDDGSCEYVINQILGCTNPIALNYNASATLNDGSCVLRTPPPWVPPEIIEIVDVINEGIREITGWTPEEQINTYKDLAVVGIVAPSIWLLVAERASIASAILRLWNIIPTLLGFRRKRRPWGTVYDSVTKQPLDPVYVTLRNSDGAEAGTSITDLDGRYGFLTEIGTYKLDAKKTDYVFPSVKMQGQPTDELYDNLYFGEDIKVEDEDEIINKNIPMDALNFNWNEFEKSKNKKLMKFYSNTELFLARIAKIIFFSGFVASFLLVFLEPRTWNYIILAIYSLIVVLALLGVRPRKPGFVIERKTGYPMSFGIITVFSALLDREVGHTIIGKTGKYHLLVPKGKYYIKLQKKTGEQTYEEVYTSDVFKVRKGYVDKVIKV